MGFGCMALDSLGIKVDKYYSSEIDKFANQAANALYPDTIQVGDVTKWKDWKFSLGSIDLLIAGFPCQAWSMAGKQKGDDDPRGALVHDLISIWRQIYVVNPNVKFMFENVKMKKEFLDYINKLFGVKPICINSALVSAQNRTRYYWTNIPGVEQPEDKGIMLKDIIEEDGEFTIMSDKFVARQRGRKCLRDDISGKAVNLSAMEYVKNGRQGDYIRIIQTPRGNNPGGIRAENGKTPCLSANSWEHNNHVTDGDKYRKLTARECMRLQTVPEQHIDTLLESGISNTQLYKMNGNGWTHDVITHIFKGLIK